MLVRRYERLDYSGATEQGGFMRVDGKLARTGVQEYRDSAGGIRRELRLPEDVKQSVAGFALAPLTNRHPPQMVSPDNAKEYVVGAVGEAKFDGKWISAPLTVYTKDAIDAVKSGRAQLSVGYQCELVDEDGEYDGQRYDCRQTGIQVNHVALVDVARAGPEARLRLDEGDAATENFDAHQVGRVASSKTTPENTESKRMLKMKIDGLEVEVADANASSIIERAIEKARADGLAKVQTEKDRADAAEKAKAEADRLLTEAKAKLDSALMHNDKMVKCDECDGKGKSDGAECKGCFGKGEMKQDAALDPKARADARSRAVAVYGAKRAKLLLQASEHLSANEKLDDLSDSEIKVKVLGKLDVKTDGKDTSYIDVRYDVEMDRLAKDKRTPAEAARAGAISVRADNTDGMSAYERMVKRNQDAFVK